ncbi:MAG: hypothetical protein KQH83_09250 [Actinobacteria bacterium]|nr:hypothetical protein [Actinomycetota bacterium]
MNIEKERRKAHHALQWRLALELQRNGFLGPYSLTDKVGWWVQRGVKGIERATEQSLSRLRRMERRSALVYWGLEEMASTWPIDRPVPAITTALEELERKVRSELSSAQKRLGLDWPIVLDWTRVSGESLMDRTDVAGGSEPASAKEVRSSIRPQDSSDPLTTAQRRGPLAGNPNGPADVRWAAEQRESLTALHEEANAWKVDLLERGWPERQRRGAMLAITAPLAVEDPSRVALATNLASASRTLSSAIGWLEDDFEVAEALILVVLAHHRETARESGMLELQRACEREIGDRLDGGAGTWPIARRTFEPNRDVADLAAEYQREHGWSSGISAVAAVASEPLLNVGYLHREFSDRLEAWSEVLRWTIDLPGMDPRVVEALCDRSLRAFRRLADSMHEIPYLVRGEALLIEWVEDEI